MTDREKFEVWYANRFGIYNSNFLRIGPHKDIYHSVVVQHAWEIWQAALASQQPADDGWIEWAGVNAPQEVRSQNVQVRWSDGSADFGPARHFYWGRNCGNPIIAYRVVKP